MKRVIVVTATIITVLSAWLTPASASWFGSQPVYVESSR